MRKKTQPFPSYLIESEHLDRFSIIAGIDEAGRGALAGPVVAGIVAITKAYVPIKAVNDSKQLTAKQREKIFEIIQRTEGIYWSVGTASNNEIDRLGIRKATMLAMLRAYWQLSIRPELILVDGVKSVHKLPISNVYYYEHGDSRVHVIALASIVAKVVRDRIMRRYSTLYPRYRFGQNKGYGTKFHKTSICKYGPCKLHRYTFLKSLELNA